MKSTKKSPSQKIPQKSSITKEVNSGPKDKFSSQESIKYVYTLTPKREINKVNWDRKIELVLSLLSLLTTLIALWFVNHEIDLAAENLNLLINQNKEIQTQTLLASNNEKAAFISILDNLTSAVDQEMMQSDNLSDNLKNRIVYTSKLLKEYPSIDPSSKELMFNSIERSILFSYLTSQSNLQKGDLAFVLSEGDFSYMNLSGLNLNGLGDSIHYLNLQSKNCKLSDMSFSESMFDLNGGESSELLDWLLIKSKLHLYGKQIFLQNVELNNSSISISVSNLEIDRLLMYNRLKDSLKYSFSILNTDTSEINRSLFFNCELEYSGNSQIRNCVFSECNVILHKYSTDELHFSNCIFTPECQFIDRFLEVAIPNPYGGLKLAPSGALSLRFSRAFISKDSFDQLCSQNLINEELVYFEQFDQRDIESIISEVGKPYFFDGGLHDDSDYHIWDLSSFKDSFQKTKYYCISSVSGR